MSQTSIIQQWVISIVFSTLPLILAVTFALWTINSQAQSQRDLLRQTLRLQTSTSQFKEELGNAERSIRQYLLLKDARFKQIYLQRYKALEQVIERLLLNLLMSAWLDNNPDKEDGFRIILELLSIEHITEQDSKSISEDFQLMTDFAQEIQQDVEQLITNALQQKEKTFKDAITTLSLLGMFVFPVTILLFLLSSRRISVPFTHLTQAIQRMGRGKWKRPISIRGPSDIVSLSETLEWMRLQLIDTEQQKQEFLSHITHELKTPLASIIEASSLLIDEIPGVTNQKQRSVLHILSRNADSLKLRIEQLLTYNAVAQRKAMSYEVIDLRNFVSEIVNNKTLLSSDIDITWKICDVPMQVQIDPVRLEMILSNLFSNAIYYSNSPATIQVHWYSDEENWRCIVSDNGKGIALEHLGKIYDPFFQGNNQRKGTLKGSGIGLAIVKKCVTSLNGNIAVMSELNKGTEFTIVFPHSGKNQ